VHAPRCRSTGKWWEIRSAAADTLAAKIEHHAVIDLIPTAELMPTAN
jgi:hypothetical protein